MSYGLRPDEKYQGRVREGSALIESQGGTLGYQVMLECEDGRTFFTIWITEKNREHAEKNFATLGVSMEKLRSPGYIEHQLGQDIVGRSVTFGTKEEEYQGKTRIKVAWIGRQSGSVDSRKAASVAAFFGGAPVAPPSTPITDDDIPF